MQPAREAKHAANSVAHDHRVKLLARLGYVAKGTFYLVMGVLALRMVAGQGGGVTDQHGVIDAIAQAPFGKLLLVLMSIGLLGLTLWRFVQAIGDTDAHGSDTKGRLARAWLVISGLSYGALLLLAVKTLAGKPSQGGGANHEALTARLMEAPFGRALVATIGVVLIGYGVKEFLDAVNDRLNKMIRFEGLAAQRARSLRMISRFGIAARAFVFALMGLFLVQAAMRFDPDRAKGIAETLGLLAAHPAGPVLLGLTALGFVAYAVYSFIEARYRQLRPVNSAR